MFATVVIILGFTAFLIVRAYESGAVREYLAELRRVWRSWGFPLRAVMVLLLVNATLTGGSKGEHPLASFYRTLLWQADAIWPLETAFRSASSASASNAVSAASVEEATNTAASVEAYAASNAVVTLSFDWAQPNRLPYHDRQNVLGRTVWVNPTNINGTLYEDHYVAFNEAATTNPAVILIEYAWRNADGELVRESAETVTNSYPIMVPVRLQSGTATCYWFRCAVPVSVTNACLRDWNGEALFGAPQGSGKGFDLLGTLVIDDGDAVWVGATTNMVSGGVTNRVRNGIVLEGQP